MKLVDGDAVIDLESIKVLELKPDDVIVVSVNDLMMNSTKFVVTLRESLIRTFPKNKVMVIDSRTLLQVITPVESHVGSAGDE